MTIRFFLVLCSVAALAAWQPAVPDSGAGVIDTSRGVGVDDPSTLAARQARDAQLSGTAIDGPVAIGTAPLPQSGTTPASQSSSARAISDPAGLDTELAQVAAQNDAAAARANSGQEVVNASPSNAAPLILNNPGISDENNFDAVASRQSIESDAARIAAQRKQYEVIQPTALPTRRGNAQPNVVQYALQTSHPRGTKVHRRTNLASASRTQRNCAQYTSADEAQIDFLSIGGPDRDRKALDPDGDGYACDWDPAPIRRASGG